MKSIHKKTRAVALQDVQYVLNKSGLSDIDNALESIVSLLKTYPKTRIVKVIKQCGNEYMELKAQDPGAAMPTLEDIALKLDQDIAKSEAEIIYLRQQE